MTSLHGFSGVGMVARNGSVVTAVCDGFADVATERPWTRCTPSQIASISKQFTAVVALALVDEGELELDEPVSVTLPDAPGHWAGVTARQLLTHTSGMTHWEDRPGFDPARSTPAPDRLAQLLAAPLVDAPGRPWRYSSPGYIVLGHVLATRARRPYADLVQEHVIDRLGLRDTTVGTSRPRDAACGYRDGEPVTAWALHTMPGTGDIWSTAEDLVVFLTALHEGELLSESVRSLLSDERVSTGAVAATTARVTTPHYGLGHFHGAIDGRPAYVHPGDNPGYLSLAAYLPETGTLVVVLSNDETDDLERAVADLAR